MFSLESTTRTQSYWIMSRFGSFQMLLKICFLNLCCSKCEDFLNQTFGISICFSSSFVLRIQCPKAFRAVYDSSTGHRHGNLVRWSHLAAGNALSHRQMWQMNAQHDPRVFVIWCSLSNRFTADDSGQGRTKRFTWKVKSTLWGGLSFRTAIAVLKLTAPRVFSLFLILP